MTSFLSLATTARLLTVTDRFDCARAPGTVVGSTASDGSMRAGVDAEGTMAVDNGALRIPFLRKPGWGRSAISYGPFRREPGLAFAVFMLNGHNTSQSDPRAEGPKARLRRWVRELPRPSYGRPVYRDNLAVGWFPDRVPAHPPEQGHTFVMHAATVLNGELQARVTSNRLRAFQGVQNLQTYFVVVLREQGAVYYVASLPRAEGPTGYPSMRPVAIDPTPQPGELYAGIHQCVLGEVGYRVDTRVYGVRVDRVEELSAWYGGSHAADPLTGIEALDAMDAEVGGRWSMLTGVIRRTAKGAVAGAVDASAVLDPAAPTGLVHLLVESRGTNPSGGLLWRHDRSHGWRVMLDVSGARLAVLENAEWHIVAIDSASRLHPDAVHSLQVLDDGKTFSVHIDGRLAFDRWFDDSRGAEATEVGFLVGAGGDLRARQFEAHPRAVVIPPVLDLGGPWAETGDEVVVDEAFAGSAGRLEGRSTPDGRRWRRELGDGNIVCLGGGAAGVEADRARPNPGRTIFTVDWDDRTFADVRVGATPPGTGRGQGEAGRAGIALWQDADNYLLVNPWLDDYVNHDGSSISSFLRSGGREDMYQAVWSNVGRKVFWGRRYELRVVCDGRRFTVWLDGEPVLHRAFTDIDPGASPLEIRRIGLAVNWEWGDDTGSIYHYVQARTRSRSTSVDLP